MKGFATGILVLVTVLQLSSAFPLDTGNGEQRNLLNSDHQNNYALGLSRNKPPAKIPGPKLTNNPETNENNMKLLSDHEGKKKKSARLLKNVEVTKESQAERTQLQ